jgi:hypothetical protein
MKCIYYIYIYTDISVYVCSYAFILYEYIKRLKDTKKRGRGRERERKKLKCEELAQEIIKDEKSHNLPSMSWRPKKFSVIIQPKSEDLRTRGASGVNSNLKGIDSKMRCPNSSKPARGKTRGFIFPLPCVLLRPSTNIKEDNLFTNSRIQMFLLFGKPQKA